MCKFYGYIRVSTETQSEKGGGLDVQTKAITQYASEHHVTIERIFQDAGISGTAESRPELDELLIETIKPGDVIIVHNTSRLWRNIFSQATVMKLVMDAKANIVSIDCPEFDVYKYMADPENFMMTSMLGMLDQWERMTIARKLARGRTTKAQKGSKPAGVCPLGYQYSADKKSVEVVPAESVIVRKMFSLAQTGSSLQEIADTLNAEGARTRHGKEFSKQAVSVILHNRFYLGELTHAGKTVSGNHQPIISSVQFGKVSKALERKQK